MLRQFSALYTATLGVMMTFHSGFAANSFELKYNIAGHLISSQSEFGTEAKFVHNGLIGGFLRLAILDRDYNNEDWNGNVVGNSKLQGHQIWVGGKVIPFRGFWFRGFEASVYYRFAKIKQEHISLRWPSESSEKIQVVTNALGLGLGYNLVFARWFVLEPFWYSDYGHYQISSPTRSQKRFVDYGYPWDDEQRFGLNFGFKI